MSDPLTRPPFTARLWEPQPRLGPLSLPRRQVRGNLAGAAVALVLVALFALGMLAGVSLIIGGLLPP